MTSKYVVRLRSIFLENDLTGIQAKILFLLIENPLTASMAARQLNIPQATASRACTGLQKMGLLTVDRVEGRNKFLVTDLDALVSENQGG